MFDRIMFRRISPWFAAVLAAGVSLSAAEAQTPPAAPPAAPPAVVAPVGMVDQPCPAGTIGRSPAVLAFARIFVADGPLDVPAMAAMAKDPVAAKEMAQRTTLDAWTKVNDWPDLCLYRADDVDASRPGATRVVFLGDSITELWRAADPDFFTGGVVDRGISGQTSPQLVARFQQDVVALHPRVVHIMIGTNDVAGNTGPNRPEDLQNNIRAMVALAKANHIHVVLASIPPAGTFTWAPALHPAPQIRELNTWLAGFAKAEGLVYVDYYAALAGPDGGMKPGLSRDGVHPLKGGYALMKPLAEEAIRRADR